LISLKNVALVVAAGVSKENSSALVKRKGFHVPAFTSELIGSNAKNESVVSVICSVQELLISINKSKRLL
jgi:hypothetical protein